MKQISKLGMGAIVCTLMLVLATGFSAASKTTTTTKSQLPEKVLMNRAQKVMGNNNSTINTKLITLLILGVLLGGVTIVSFVALKHRMKALFAYCSGAQTALIIDMALVLLLQKKQPQNNTNSTL